MPSTEIESRKTGRQGEKASSENSICELSRLGRSIVDQKVPEGVRTCYTHDHRKRSAHHCRFLLGSSSGRRARRRRLLRRCFLGGGTGTAIDEWTWSRAWKFNTERRHTKEYQLCFSSLEVEGRRRRHRDPCLLRDRHLVRHPSR